MKCIVLALCLLAAPALAQPSPVDMQTQRNTFMSAFAQCDTVSIALQAEIAALKKQIEELKKPAADQPPAK